eukprot:1274343-Pleurochrysis_carterae.AAC.1
MGLKALIISYTSFTRSRMPTKLIFRTLSGRSMQQYLRTSLVAELPLSIMSSNQHSLAGMSERQDNFPVSWKWVIIRCITSSRLVTRSQALVSNLLRRFRSDIVTMPVSYHAALL